jgi:hypothetical protein
MLEEFRVLFEDGIGSISSYKNITSTFLEENFPFKDPEVKQHEWKEIKPLLKKAALKIQVKALNGSSADVLSYYDNQSTGLSVIAIGGDKLSRGLTLEGLSVSYFLRASKMYDTLMQMGRWFGYRPGYCDLCRLFTSSELNEWFRHIATASDELRAEFEAMCDVGSTPDAYRLMVRTHPGVLQVTATNKMRHSRHLQLSWSSRLLETYALSMDEARIQMNFELAKKLVQRLPNVYETVKNNYLWRGVDPTIVTEFISSFTVAKTLHTANAALVLNYIQSLNCIGELNQWNVMIINKTTDQTAVVEYSNTIKVGAQKRTRAADTGDSVYCIRKHHIIGQHDDILDLSEEQLKLANERMLEINPDWNGTYPSGRIVREEFRSPNEPLFILYTLDPYYANPLDRDGNIDLDKVRFQHNDIPFIGYAIAFPKTHTGYTVNYTANMVEDFEYTEDMFVESNDNEYNNLED